MAKRDDPLADWMADLPPEFVTCRDLGHSWRPWRAWNDTDEREYVQILRCSRCKTNRTRSIDYRGGRGSNRYSYPDDYQAPKGHGLLGQDGRADLRLLAIQRFIEQAGDTGPAKDAR